MFRLSAYDEGSLLFVTKSGSFRELSVYADSLIVDRRQLDGVVKTVNVWYGQILNNVLRYCSHPNSLTALTREKLRLKRLSDDETKRVQDLLDQQEKQI